VGLAVGAPKTLAGGPVDLVVSDPAGTRLAAIAAGDVWEIVKAGGALVATSPRGGSVAPAERLVLTALTPGEPVRVNGRTYRGTIELLPDPSGVTVVNRLGLEEYLQGVVSAEMGRRSLAEREALRAQAVVSRTYATRTRRRWAAQGFDLYGTIADQVYGGMSAETPEGNEAVASTRGQILTYGGAPIDAFFYSTCGGRTAEGTEVFRAANRPYLRSIADVAENGVAYCSISPRYRWREEWSGEALLATLRRTLPASTGTPAARVNDISAIRVVYRTGSGRVGQLGIALAETEVRVDGPAVRGVLRTAAGDMLRSNAFDLVVTNAGHRVTRLAAEGGGAGHGVGLCQWGAVGRSRVGHDYQRILFAYYPGTTLQRLY
jgi:stage II sporulation protein D